MIDEPHPDPPSPEVDAGDLVGRVLAGRYRVLRRLGVGAMGAVYVAEHTRIGRQDAIKVLRAAMARDPEAIARFTRGARNVSRIRHPNVCTLYDFGNTEEGFHFLAMEFVDGPTLGTLLEREGPLPLDRAVNLIGQVGEALQAAHALGIVHRDLKPDNIMVARAADGSEQVKVVDFDIARGPAEEEGPAVTRHGFVVGTPEYMSPEQLTGDPLDGRSDIYSMALVLFRMLTGRLPFEGSTAQEIMVQRLTREPMTLGQATGSPFPQALEEAVSRGLRRKADERPGDARTFANEVRSTLSGAPPITASSGVPSSPAAAPSGGSGGAAQIPPTRIPSSMDPVDSEGTPVLSPLAGGVGGTTATPDRPAPPPTKRSGSPVVLGAIGLVLLLVVGGGAILWLSGAEEAPPTEVAVAGETLPPPVEDPAEEDSRTVEDTAEGEPATTGTDATPPSPAPTATEQSVAPPARQTAEPPQAPVSPPEETRDVESTPTLSAEGIRDILLGHFSALNDAPSRSTAEAARDTATAAWGTAGVAELDRALAAWVNGQAMLILGDSVQGVEWLGRAVSTHPQPPAGWVAELNLHRDAPR